MTKLKEQVIRIVKGLPDDATIDDVMAELYFKLQVDAGLKELDEGKGISHAAVEKRLSRWLAK
jgi:predicted transcriptional regulator